LIRDGEKINLFSFDYPQGKLDTTSRQFKIITGIACLIGLAVPIFGANPIQAQILTQVFNVFVLPLVIVGILIRHPYSDVDTGLFRVIVTAYPTRKIRRQLLYHYESEVESGDADPVLHRLIFGKALRF